jgi:hypothetical protein
MIVWQFLSPETTLDTIPSTPMRCDHQQPPATAIFFINKIACKRCSPSGEDHSKNEYSQQKGDGSQ